MPSWSKKPDKNEKKNEKSGGGNEKCGACNGARKVPLTDPDDGSTVYYDCSTCSGSGKKK